MKAGGTAPSQRIHRSKVQEELYFLSRLLQHEFVYGTEGLEANMAATIAGLEVSKGTYSLSICHAHKEALAYSTMA